jgi:predicted amidophosphoribosyltransferase
MELHRTEQMPSPTGALVTVTIIGVARHDQQVRNHVLQLKYGHERKHAFDLACIVAPIITKYSHADVLTWAATNRKHIRERGMDHAELIARHVAGITGLPIRKYLRRMNTESQTGASRDERLRQPLFVARPLGRFRDVVVIDDVVTTASTFHAAAKALVTSGARSVLCIAPSAAL